MESTSKTNDSEYKKGLQGNRNEAKRYIVCDLKLSNKKRGRTYESGIAVTEDAKGSVQPPAANKCNHCGLTNHFKGRMHDVHSTTAT